MAHKTASDFVCGSGCQCDVIRHCLHCQKDYIGCDKKRRHRFCSLACVMLRALSDEEESPLSEALRVVSERGIVPVLIQNEDPKRIAELLEESDAGSRENFKGVVYIALGTVVEACSQGCEYVPIGFFGARTSKDSKKIGQRVYRTLRAHGIKAIWNGNPSRKILAAVLPRLEEEE